MTLVSPDYIHFEHDIADAFGPVIRASRAYAGELWAAIANVDWRHTSGRNVYYSWRGAGGCVARALGDFSRTGYMDWYMSHAPVAEVPEWVAIPMKVRGWTFEHGEALPVDSVTHEKDSTP